MRAFDCEAEHVYAVTLSAELSGSYNSAVLGKNLLQEDHPDRQIHVFNSKSASVGQTLIAMKIQECEEAGLPFEQVIETVDAYIEQQHTFLCWTIWRRFVKMADSAKQKHLWQVHLRSNRSWDLQKKVQSVSLIRQEE